MTSDPIVAPRAIPRPDHMLVLRDAAETRTESGIELPEKVSQNQRRRQGTVVAVGDGVESVKVGQRIMWAEEHCAELEIDGTKYLLMSDDLYACILPEIRPVVSD